MPEGFWYDTPTGPTFTLHATAGALRVELPDGGVVERELVIVDPTQGRVRYRVPPDAVAVELILRES